MVNKKREFPDNESEATMESDYFGEGVFSPSNVKDLKPMKHSSIAKLKKIGKLNETHLIGGMLKPETAKELYKNNIRVHHRFYIPKDKRKYFHEEELKGGKLDLGKAFKKIGSTAKHIFNKGTEAVKHGINKTSELTQKAVENVGSYTNTLLHGRNDYPPKVRSLIQTYGSLPIKSIIIDRTPVPGLITGALNAVSFGAFAERMEKEPYDKLYHLRIDVTFTNGKRLAVEKNEVINMYENPTKLAKSEQLQISNVPQEITLNSMLEHGKKVQGGKFFKYSAYDNNCQDFIVALVNNFANQQELNFIKQNTKSLFANDPTLRKIANTVTDLGAKVNEITTGTGLHDEHYVQSVLFSKPEWTIKRAENWLKKHGYKHSDVDIKPEHYRFRQMDPEELKANNYHFITKSIGKEIELIIAYKNITSNKKYNKMPRKHSVISKYESSSESESSSDESTSGTGIHPERRIIKKLNKIRDEIHEHNEMHGGKINIAKAFKKLGSTIKSGFVKDIEKPVVSTATKVGDYVTAKKGGLASDLLHTGVPIVTGALAGLAGEALAPEGGIVSGTIAGELGSRAGSKLADYIGSETGTGLFDQCCGKKNKIGVYDPSNAHEPDMGFSSIMPEPTHIEFITHKPSLSDIDNALRRGVILKTRTRDNKTITWTIENATVKPKYSSATVVPQSRIDEDPRSHRMPINRPTNPGSRGLGTGMGTGDLIHIDVASHNARGRKATNKMEGGRITRKSKRTSMEELIETHREKEQKKLQEALLLMASDINKEKHPPKAIPYAKPLGTGFKKGSPEAKEHMARIRAMRGKK